MPRPPGPPRGQGGPESTQAWTPQVPQHGGGRRHGADDPEGTGSFVPDFSDEPAEPARPRTPGSRPGAGTAAAAAAGVGAGTRGAPGRGQPREPALLTHAAPAAHASPGADHRHDGYDDGAGGDGGDDGGGRDRTARWRRLRKIGLVGALLGILLPVLVFFAGYLTVDVPSPSALAAERKQVTTILASDGSTELGRYVPEEGNRIEVDLDQVPEHVQNAVLAAEDRSFRSNPGFDVVGIGRAAWNQLTGGTGGGSTVTQQYVKVATGDDDYSLFRKFREVIIAAKMTKQNSKDQILEDYLNTIYFGRGAYGIQAASQAFFGKNVQDLLPTEAAVLAGAIQAPSRWDPAKNLPQAQFRWNFVLDGMVAEGWLPRAEREVAQYPATVPPEQVSGSPTDDRAHVAKRVLDELEDNGISREQLARDGGRITTTIDPRAQGLARDTVLAELDGQPQNLHSSLVAIDPHTGAVLAYYGGQDGTGFDLAGGPAWNPGSSFKPFAMLAALEQGIGINSIYDGDSPLEIDGIPYANNESRSYNALPLREAMRESVNTTFIQLAYEVGPPAVREAAIQAGIPEQVNGKTALVEPNGGPPGVGIALGQYPVHTIDMASAYATFAADGMRRHPFFVREYADSRGNINFAHADEPEPAFDQRDPQRNSQLARNVTATLTEVARSSRIPLDGNRQVAAKTGTHQRGDTGTNSAAWTVGYTPSISTAVWVGDPANTAIKDEDGNDILGRGLPGSIWQRFMNSYLEGAPQETFPAFKLIQGDNAGPAAAQVAPPPPTQRPTPSPVPTTEAPPTEEFEPEPTEETAEPTEEAPREQCGIFGCDEPPTDEPDPWDGPGNRNRAGDSDPDGP